MRGRTSGGRGGRGDRANAPRDLGDRMMELRRRSTGWTLGGSLHAAGAPDSASSSDGARAAYRRSVVQSQPTTDEGELSLRRPARPACDKSATSGIITCGSPATNGMVRTQI